MITGAWVIAVAWLVAVTIVFIAAVVVAWVAACHSITDEDNVLGIGFSSSVVANKLFALLDSLRALSNANISLDIKVLLLAGSVSSLGLSEIIVPLILDSNRGCESVWNSNTFSLLLGSLSVHGVMDYTVVVSIRDVAELVFKAEPLDVTVSMAVTSVIVVATTVIVAVVAIVLMAVVAIMLMTAAVVIVTIVIAIMFMAVVITIGISVVTGIMAVMMIMITAMVLVTLARMSSQ